MTDEEMNAVCTALLLVFEARGVPESMWKPYLDLLPTIVPNYSSLVPGERLHLQGTSSRKDFQELTLHLYTATRITLLLCTHHPELFPSSVFTPEAMSWACGMLASRQFEGVKRH